MFIEIDLKKFQHILAVQEAHISDKENGQICIGYVWWNKTEWQSHLLCTQSSKHLYASYWPVEILCLREWEQEKENGERDWRKRMEKENGERDWRKIMELERDWAAERERRRMGKDNGDRFSYREGEREKENENREREKER